MARWLSIAPIVGGLGLLVRITLVGIWDRVIESRRVFILEGPDPEHRSWSPRFPPAAPISGLPSFGLVRATILSFVMMAWLVEYSNRPWNELGNDLKEELKRRPYGFVYLEADPNLSWGVVANTTDTIRALHARVVLLRLENRSPSRR
jgi:hypothetical protein